MKKHYLLIILLIWAFLSGCSQETKENEVTINTQNSTSQNSNVMTQTNSVPDKIEVVIFHWTYKCYSCTRMSELLMKTLNDNFAKELEDKKIEFKEINWELQLNFGIVSQYKATWLSVFINWIKDWKNNIKELTDIWRYLENEDKFKETLTQEINNL